jgi:ABC-2 type transport system permease protein/oleandomycin transport system permease protein
MSARTDIASVEEKGRGYWVFMDALVLTKRSLMHIPRVPELLVFATIQPVMFVLLFRYVFGGAIDVQGGSYVNFLMAGIFVQTVAFGSVATGIGLAEDMQRGLIDRFRSLPMSRSAVLIGRIVSDLVRNAFVVLVMLAVGLLVGFRPDANVFEWLLTGVLLLLVSFSFSWVGAALALRIRSVEAMQSAGFIWLFPLTFASSAFVETASMPGWLRAFADNQPITHAVDAVRGLMLNLPPGTLDRPVAHSVWLAFAWLGGLVVVFVPLAVRLYRRSVTA